MGINFTVDVQASGLPAIVDQASGGLEGFDVSVSYNSSVLRADGMSFALPLCPHSDGCIFDTPLNNTLTYHNSTSIAGGTARLAMIGLGAGHRATNSTGPTLPPILFRIRFLVVGKGVTPIAIAQSSQLTGYSGNSCSLLSYQLTGTSNGSFDNRPPFTLSANPPSLSVVAGLSNSATVMVNATRANAIVNVTLVLSGLVNPIGSPNATYVFKPRTAILSPGSLSFTSDLTISTTTSAKLGTYHLNITGATFPPDPYNQVDLQFNLTIIPTGSSVPASPSGSSFQVSTTPAIPTSTPGSSPSTPPVIATFTFNSSAIVGTRVGFVPTVWCGTSPYSFAWSFGDGATSTNNSATHTYSTAGTYNVTLTVTDSAGQTFTSSHTVNVEAQPVGAPSAPDTGLLTGVILVLFLLIATSFVLSRRRRRTRR